MAQALPEPMKAAGYGALSCLGTNDVGGAVGFFVVAPKLGMAVVGAEARGAGADPLRNPMCNSIY